jgi:hypothetical protein
MLVVGGMCSHHMSYRVCFRRAKANIEDGGGSSLVLRSQTMHQALNELLEMLLYHSARVYEPRYAACCCFRHPCNQSVTSFVMGNSYSVLVLDRVTPYVQCTSTLRAVCYIHTCVQEDSGHHKQQAECSDDGLRSG